MKLKKLLHKTGEFDYKYLILELMIVVCGILIAFWIDTTWDERVKTKRVNDYTRALEVELIQARKGFEKNLAILQADIQTSLVLLDHINSGPASISDDSLYVLLWKLRPQQKYIPRKAVLDDLTNSGVLSEFDSELLRRSVASYINAIEQDKELQSQVQDQIQQQILDVQIPHIDFSEVLPDTSIFVFGNKTKLNIPDMKFKSDPEQLFNRDFANYLFNRISLTSSVIQSHTNVLSEIETGLLLIGTFEKSGEKPVTSFEG